jgi:hypothetical protein
MSAKRKSKRQAKKAPKAQRAPSPFWSPKAIGDGIKGKFQKFQNTVLPKGGKGMAVVLDVGLVGLGYCLKGQFSQVAPKAKVGDKVEIVYVGKGGRAMIYTLKYNGKDIPQLSGFQPATKDEIKEFFSK